MGRRNLLEVNVISAQGLKLSTHLGKARAYAVAWVHPSKRLYTHVDDEGGCDPVWEDKLSLSIKHHDTDPLSSSKLTIEIFERGHIHDRLVGIVEVPLKEIHPQFMAFPIRRPSGRTRGVVNLSIKLREMYCSSSSSSSSSESDSSQERRRRRSPAPPPMAQPVPTEYAYPPSGGYPYPSAYSAPPPPVYASPPPPPPYAQVTQHGTRGSMGLALGAGLAAGVLGGLVLGEALDHVEERAAEEGAEQALDEGGYYNDDY